MRTFLAASAALTILVLGGCSAEAPSDDASPTDERSSAWDAESATDEANSTHLFIVDKAIARLAAHPESPAAVAAVARLNEATCRSSWQQGLLDADFKAAYNNGRRDTAPGDSNIDFVISGATWASHFYNPPTGKNWRGQTSPVAKSESIRHAEAARTKLEAGDAAGGCYELGLSLHYMTDITQPMHTALFTAKSYPLLLHSHMESYAQTIQDRYVAPAGPLPAAAEPMDQVLERAAVGSLARWQPLRDAIAAAYSDRHCGRFKSAWYDSDRCWKDDAAVDAQIGEELIAAQTDAADFILALNASLAGQTAP